VSDRFDARKVPVDAVVAVVVVDCDSVVKVVGVVALSEIKITGNILTVAKGHYT